MELTFNLHDKCKLNCDFNLKKRTISGSKLFCTVRFNRLGTQVILRSFFYIIN